MSCNHNHGGELSSRRKFLRVAALGSGAMLFSTLPVSARAAGDVQALLLTCMDYRLTDDIVAYMTGRGLDEKYDHVILAGASLGALTDQRPDWGKTFWQHLDVAIDLHHVHEVIVLDHKDCGAYRVFLGADAVKTAEAELALHSANLRQLKAAILQKHPDLKVELGLMSLDGSVQAIA